MPTYRIDQTYDWNYENGPSLDGPLPPVPRTPAKDFLGFPVASRIGIAAGLLLNSRWIGLYARLGFDILTYKTVRARHRECYPLPNWVFLDVDGPLDRDPARPVVRRHVDPGGCAAGEIATITSSVSFGMPSKDPEVWRADVARAREVIGPQQVLVVSVVASPRPGDGPERLVEEFGTLAGMASAAGAHVVEANLSCPNVCTAEGQVYLDAGLSGDVSRAMRAAVGDDVPILLKAGHFASRETLDGFLGAVDDIATGVVLVNGVSRPIVEPDGRPAFGAGREVAGVLGHGIHGPCLENVREAVETVKRDRLSLRVVAVGGVLDEASAGDFFDAGASAVMMGGAPMYDPGLAVRFKKAHPEW